MTEFTVELAAMAALFLRRLVDEGVPMSVAVQLTQSYVSSTVVAMVGEEEPAEPWEDNGQPG